MYIYNPTTLISTLGLELPGRPSPVVRGNELSCCCPQKHWKNGIFQHEMNPSFSVNLVSGYFNCYSCGLSGGSLEDLYASLGKLFPYLQKIKKQENRQELLDPLLYYTEKDVTGNRQAAIDYFASRGCDVSSVADRLNLGASPNGDFVYLPVYAPKYVGFLSRQVSGPLRWSNSYFFPKDLTLYADYSRKVDDLFFLESSSDRVFCEASGVPAASSMMSTITDWQLEVLLSLKAKRIIAIPQNDRAGQKWLTRLLKIKHRKPIYVYKIPQEFKDIFEYKNLQNLTLKRL